MVHLQWVYPMGYVLPVSATTCGLLYDEMRPRLSVAVRESG